jgi:hypothetical protein
MDRWKDQYVFCCARSVRSELVCFETGIWKLNWLKKEYEKKEDGCAERKTLYMCDTIKMFGNKK